MKCTRLQIIAKLLSLIKVRKHLHDPHIHISNTDINPNKRILKFLSITQILNNFGLFKCYLNSVQILILF